MARMLPVRSYGPESRWRVRRPLPYAALLLVGGAALVFAINLATLLSLGSSRGCAARARLDGEIDVVLAVLTLVAFALPASAGVVVALKRRNPIIAGALGGVAFAVQVAILILLPRFSVCRGD